MFIRMELRSRKRR